TVDSAPSRDPFRRPLHPYTVSLLPANPAPDPARRRPRIVLRGDVPSPSRPPTGCRLHTRCFMAQPICATEEPMLREVQPGHHAACHFAEALLQGAPLGTAAGGAPPGAAGSGG